MTAFAAALATLLRDGNLGTGATFKPGGVGPGVAVRVVRSRPDAVGAGFDTALLQATDVLTAAVADISAPAAGDTFDIGADTLTVQHAERDAAGVAWRIYCRR